MTSAHLPHFASAAVRFARVTGIAVALLALLALLGWAFNIDLLKSLLHPNRIAMNPATAVAFMMCGLSLTLACAREELKRARQIGKALALTGVLVGAVKLLAYVGWRVPVDRLLFTSKLAGNVMAPNTAFGFVLVGSALLLLDVRVGRGHRPAIALGLLLLGLSLLAITGYMYGNQYLYRVGGFIPMALNTATAFFALALAILCARPSHEPMATLLSDTAGGVVARRLLPSAILLPLILGWLRILGEDLGLYNNAFGVTIFSLSITAIFVALIWWNARSLLKLDVQRRAAEEALEDQFHLLRTLIDHLPDYIYIKDSDGRFLLNNPAHLTAIGARSQEQVAGKTDFDVFPQEMAAEFRADEVRILETEQPQIAKEERVLSHTEGVRWMTATKVPYRNARGQIAGLVGISHDITRRKAAEQERDRFFTLSLDMLAICGFDGYFRRVNAAWEKTLGYTAEELMARPWVDFVHPDDRNATIAEGQKLSEGAVTLYFENRYRCRDGSYKWLAWSAVPVVKDGVIYAVARDMTGPKEAEAQLHETNRRLDEAVHSERQAMEALKQAQSHLVQTEKLAGLGQMVAGVAHEINNPLSFVSNNVAVLQRDLRAVTTLLELYRRTDPVLAEKEPALVAEIRGLAERMDLAYTLGNLQELLTRSRDGLKRIQQIVKDLRDFARLDRSDLQSADLNAGIESTLNIVVGHAKKKRVKLETDLSPLPAVTCHPAKINQVVMNLVSNAIDACPEEGTVTVRSRAVDSAVRIEVSDTGGGIDPAIRDRIFDPFFTTKPIGQGTGLGLSISYGIVHDHGGAIAVDSEPGKGATFIVTVPVVANEAAAPTSVRQMAGEPVAPSPSPLYSGDSGVRGGTAGIAE